MVRFFSRFPLRCTFLAIFKGLPWIKTRSSLIFCCGCGFLSFDGDEYLWVNVVCLVLFKMKMKSENFHFQSILSLYCAVPVFVEVLRQSGLTFIRAISMLVWRKRHRVSFPAAFWWHCDADERGKPITWLVTRPGIFFSLRRWRWGVSSSSTYSVVDEEEEEEKEEEEEEDRLILGRSRRARDRGQVAVSALLFRRPATSPPGAGHRSSNGG